jgi:hypothetical protein
VKTNTQRYLLSLGEEIKSQSTRIRDLIGDRHWLTDGHQKEYVLREALSRHVPASTIVSRGFVVHPTKAEHCSNEQDILIVDTHAEAPVFNQGGVIVVFPRSVLAAISVKTRLTKQTLIESIRGLGSVRRVAKASGTDPNAIWCGSYCFEEAVGGKEKLIENHVHEAIGECEALSPLLGKDLRCPSGPNVIATSGRLFFRIDHGAPDDKTQMVTQHVRGYDCNGLATAEFLADLLDHIASRRGLTESQFLDFSESQMIMPRTPEKVSVVQRLG